MSTITTFGKIKHIVGTKFKVPHLHKSLIFIVCKKVTAPNEVLILNVRSNMVFEPSDIMKDSMKVLVITKKGK